MTTTPTITAGVVMYHPDLDLEARGSWVFTMTPQTPGAPQSSGRARGQHLAQKAAEGCAELMGLELMGWHELAPRIWQLLAVAPAAAEDDLLICEGQS
jgi:hypothetical protein